MQLKSTIKLPKHKIAYLIGSKTTFFLELLPYEYPHGGPLAVLSSLYLRLTVDDMRALAEQSRQHL